MKEKSDLKNLKKKILNSLFEENEKLNIAL